MDTIKQKLSSAKKFVQDHQTIILGTATVLTTTAVVLQRVGLNQHNDFLEKKGLRDEFYAQTDETE